MSDCPGWERCPLVTRPCKACGRDVPGSETEEVERYHRGGWLDRTSAYQGIEYQHRSDGMPCGPLGEATCPSGCGAK